METLPSKSARRYDLDWLRVLAFLLLIYYHTGLIFCGEDWSFHIKNAEASENLEYLLLFVNQWRLPLLFLVSGAGVRFALGFRTPGEFTRERLKRLLIPLAIGMLLVVPPQVYVERLQQGVDYGSFLNFYPHVFNGAYPEGNFSWHHLWFIAYLLAFSLLALPVFLYLRSPAGGRLVARLGALCAKRGVILLLAVPLVAIYLLLRARFPDNRNLVDDWYNFAFYLTIFLYGYLICSNQIFWEVIERDRIIFLSLGIACLVALYIFYWIPVYDLLPGGRTGVAYSLLKCLNIWAWLLTFVGFAKRHLNFNNALLRSANEAVYPFYILHQTVIIVLGFYVIQWQAGIALKFFVITTATFVITALLYIAIRSNNVTRVMFGLKPMSASRVEAEEARA